MAPTDGGPGKEAGLQLKVRPPKGSLRRGLQRTGGSRELQESPGATPFWKGTALQLGKHPVELVCPGERADSDQPICGICWAQDTIPVDDFFSLPPEQAEALAVAGTQRPQPVPAPVLCPAQRRHQPPRDRERSRWGQRKGPRLWSVTSALQPQARRSLLGSASSAEGMHSGTRPQTPSTAPHPAHPAPPVLLIHKLTSPNRPPLPVTKITIFKIHSRAFAYTRCTDWNLKGDMQNAMCG